MKVVVLAAPAVQRCMAAAALLCGLLIGPTKSIRIRRSLPTRLHGSTWSCGKMCLCTGPPKPSVAVHARRVFVEVPADYPLQFRAPPARKPHRTTSLEERVKGRLPSGSRRQSSPRRPSSQNGLPLGRDSRLCGDSSAFRDRSTAWST